MGFYGLVAPFHYTTSNYVSHMREGGVFLLLYTNYFSVSHLLPLDFPLHLCTLCWAVFDRRIFKVAMKVIATDKTPNL